MAEGTGDLKCAFTLVDLVPAAANPRHERCSLLHSDV
jgi:hypothetical protein